MKILVQFTLVLAIIGNLTIPQTLVKYSPCCYDEHGNLTFACQVDSPIPGTRGTALKSHRSCCDPINITLRGSPAPQVNDVSAPTMPDTGWQATTVQSFILAPCLDRGVCALGNATTGPPVATTFLTLHGRLNL